MFKKIDIRSALVSAIVAAVLFCIPVCIYICNAVYTQSWLLYTGSFLFVIVIWVHTLRDNGKRGENESTAALIFASHVATAMGILLASFFSFLLLALLVPDYLDSGMADKVLTNQPANTIHDKTNGLSFQVFMAATIINFCVGSFAGIILPFYSKRNQDRDSKEPTPLHQRGTK